ncbi:MAG: glycosyl transferase family 90 [Pseudomonadota bacterium]
MAGGRRRHLGERIGPRNQTLTPNKNKETNVATALHGTLNRVLGWFRQASKPSKDLTPPETKPSTNTSQHRSQISKTFDLTYVPRTGKPSAKGERLIEYCIGPQRNLEAGKAEYDPEYSWRTNYNYFETQSDMGFIQTTQIDPAERKTLIDQKRIVQALVDQNAAFPNKMSAWITSGDSAGRKADLSYGRHLTGMRDRMHGKGILMPTSNRNRLMGPKLAQQMRELETCWTSWDDKADKAWWGGDVTGFNWYIQRQKRKVLSRPQVLEYFIKHPSEERLTLWPVSNIGQPSVTVPLKGKFTKEQAFRHKALVLLPGNDIASGISWYFCGNSPVMMQASETDHILLFELEEWEHYIPITEEPSSILQQTEWLLNNQKEAQEIAKRAHDRLRWFAGDEYIWACNEVLKLVSAC